MTLVLVALEVGGRLACPKLIFLTFRNQGRQLTIDFSRLAFGDYNIAKESRHVC